jgi:hypothetical protein
MNRLLLTRISLAVLAFSMGMGSPNVVVISAAQVTGANDIEFAIEVATDNGTRPGTVILDARDGDFVYTGADRSINIYSAGVTLRSENGARIANCDDGVFFDNFTTSRVTIEGIEFDCSGVGIIAPWGTHEHLTIRDNKIISPVGISLHQIQGAKMIGNNIIAEWRGISLDPGTNDNKIISNVISGVQQSGIYLGEGVFGNKVHGNKVSCAPGHSCLTVNASPEVLLTNKISGNKP